MSDSNKNPSVGSDKQRDQLMESEKTAHRNQPQNVKDEAVDDKIVSINPDETGKAPIQGLDTK